MNGARGFRPGLPLTLQAGAALAVVLALAVWQIARGLEKTALQAASRERMAQPPTATVDAATPDFARVSLTGRFDDDRAFLVGLASGGRTYVFAPLDTGAGAFLVNRGWIALPAGLSTIPAPAGEVTVAGVAWPRPALTRFAENEVWPDGWPKRVRGVDIDRMAAALGAHPREIRLQAGSAGALQAASTTWDYAPGTHWGYAAQWLGIGLLVAVGYVVIGKRRGRREPADG